MSGLRVSRFRVLGFRAHVCNKKLAKTWVSGVLGLGLFLQKLSGVRGLGFASGVEWRASNSQGSSVRGLANGFL